MMQNTIAKDTLREFVKRNEVVIANGDKGLIKKGDTFVQYELHRTLIFMKVNDVEHTESMDFCNVTWYMLDAKGLNVQSRFPMVAPNGVFWGFAPIEGKIHKNAVTLMRDCDAKIKGTDTDREKKALAQKCRRKLIRMIRM